MGCYAHWCLHGCLGSELCLQIFISRTLPTEPWHQPQLLFFFLWPNTWQETAEGERLYFGSQCELSWHGSPGCRHWRQLHPQSGNRENKCRYFTDFNFLLILWFQPMEWCFPQSGGAFPTWLNLSGDILTEMLMVFCDSKSPQVENQESPSQKPSNKTVFNPLKPYSCLESLINTMVLYPYLQRLWFHCPLFGDSTWSIVF